MHGQRIVYIRVSSFDQNPGRQLEHVEVDRMFTEKASGKDTHRSQLDTLNGSRISFNSIVGTGFRCVDLLNQVGMKLSGSFECVAPRTSTAGKTGPLPRFSGPLKVHLPYFRMHPDCSLNLPLEHRIVAPRTG